MKTQSVLRSLSIFIAVAAFSIHAVAAQKKALGATKIQHVLLLSIDGMHAVDFYNCANGIAGTPYCPNLAALSATAINYVNAESSKPSDSFPGLAAIVTGALGTIALMSGEYIASTRVAGRLNRPDPLSRMT